MSLLTYLKLAKDNAHNAPNIFKGFVNAQLGNLYLSDVEKQIIADRLVICKDCPLMSRNVPYEQLSESSKQRPELHCTACGCVIEFKTASFGEQCPKGYWRAWTEEQLKVEKEKVKEEN